MPPSAASSPRAPRAATPKAKRSEVELGAMPGAAERGDADGWGAPWSPPAPGAPAAGAPPAADASPRAHKARPLTLLPLVALIFYDVSGGPFGVEDAVSAGAPLLALLGFLLLPLAWSVPEALVTAELATAFPENSGFVAWVTAAYGPWWGFQEGFWKWLSGVTDNAVYPVVFLTYLQQVAPVLEAGWPRM
jgi:hypothetical protein